VAMMLLTAPWLWRSLHDGVMLLLTIATLCLLVGVASTPVTLDAGSHDWLQSWGRLSYEIYLTHMFVVFAAVRIWRTLGADMHTAAGWYVPVLLLCWGGGAGWSCAHGRARAIDGFADACCVEADEQPASGISIAVPAT